VTFEVHFRYYKSFHCLYINCTACTMYEVSCNGRTSYVSNYFYCHIRPEESYNAECDLSAIAKFLVHKVMTKNDLFYILYSSVLDFGRNLMMIHSGSFVTIFLNVFCNIDNKQGQKQVRAARMADSISPRRQQQYALQATDKRTNKRTNEYDDTVYLTCSKTPTCFRF